jgi:hypothetical protein
MTSSKTPSGCSKCKRAFNPEAWARSKWTLTGWSPWCPQCHADHSQDDWNRFNNRRKPGPKPKRQEPPHA